MVESVAFDSQFIQLLANCYRPQTKLGQGNVFTAVCDSVHGGSTWAGTPQAGTPPAGTPPRQVQYPGKYTPRQVHPPAGTPPRQVHPRQSMLGYGQQVGGTHPTGMHSCFLIVSRFSPHWLNFFYVLTTFTLK